MTDPFLDGLVPQQPLSLVSQTRVPNVQPTVSVPYRLAIIGEAPGADEEAHGIPFVGASGKLLNSILSSVGILREGCFVGNVCKYRPPGNDIEEFGYDHPKVQEGWQELQSELLAFAPHCILALGNTPLKFLTGQTGISVWQGSILQTQWGKVVPALHPAAVLREYSTWVMLRFDARRARMEADSADFSVPQRNLELNLSANEICNRLDNWPAGQLFSFDIEGGLDSFPCCSVAGSSNTGFIIAWTRHSEIDQGRIAASLSRALYSADIPKVLQNSLYDRFVLAYKYRMLIRNVVEDTMLKQWEIYPELPKGLGTIAHLWTREPAYKFERKTDDQETFYRYCIKDSCVTLEACLAQDGALSDSARRHYRFNVELLNPLLYMELRGIAYNSSLAATELSAAKAALAECASRLELRTLPFLPTPKSKTTTCSLTGAGGSLSSTRLKYVLYTQKGYPEQKTGRGPTAKVSTDVEALLKLSKKFPNDTFLADILLHRKLESVKETLEVQTDPDGRVRCGYNLVGTETGRLTCYTSPTGSGANLQTITKKLRKLYTADEGMWLFQCDLSGADGWTVAAHCLKHNDPTMWDDYTTGIKPAKVLALMYEHGASATICSKSELKERCKAIDQDGWLYFACKMVQHGSNYGMQESTMSTNIMKASYKIFGRAIHVTPADCATLQRLYFIRYPGILRWHQWAKIEVESNRNLTSASGHERKFFGRRKSWDYKSKSMAVDHETWKEFLADEPQENTTYATNLALHRLWHDPSNRRGLLDESIHPQKRSGLIIEPLHQVHDALIGQFPKDRTEWAVAKIRSWFNNELVIANTKVVIPFEGAYGPSWGELGYDNKKKPNDPEYRIYGGGEI